ncbi:unnamed protein product [Oppiella nova]|uniref:C2H2-type domain-containing protein n=1 Tax=Oppiella nova TaxID=334625 RepID=A0A7R9M694_9ACAR|nr:unnamed protein product [Oppiella nova]CAG2171435.1 unnamed protein product [Oppiella nova]
MDIHATINKYRCSRPGCGQEFRDITDFKHHLELHRHPGNYRCLWPGCYRQLSCNTALKTHMCEHTGSRRYRCHWPGCEYNTQHKRSDDQKNEESIGDQEVVIESEDNHNNGSSDEEMCDKSQDNEVVNRWELITDLVVKCETTDETNGGQLGVYECEEGIPQDIHSTDGLFVCSLNGCKTSFELKPNLTRHQLVVHPEAFPDIPWMVCSHTDCQYRTKHVNAMTQHSRRHTKPFECTRCGQTFSRNIYLSLHSKKHCKQSVRVGTRGSGCGNTSVTKRRLKPQTNGQTVVSQDVNTNEKSINSNELKSDSNDSQSDSRLQTSEGLHVCDYVGCGKGFAKLMSLSLHKRSHDKTITKTSHGRYVCDYIGCGKSFASKDYWYKHRRIHSIHSGLTYRCDVDGCTAFILSALLEIFGNVGSRVRSRNACKRIKRRERRFTCPVEECLQTYKTKYEMIHHQLRQHPDSVPDVPWIQCTHTDCQFRTKSKDYFNAHVRHHSKHYRCDQCRKWFTHLCQLKLHEPTHNKALKQYRCEWPGCKGAKCTTRAGINKHMETHTSKRYKSNATKKHLTQVLPQIGCHRRSGDQTRQQSSDCDDNSSRVGHQLNAKKVVIKSEVSNECHINSDTNDETIGGSVDESEDTTECENSLGSDKTCDESDGKTRAVSDGTSGQFVCHWSGCGKRFTSIADMCRHKPFDTPPDTDGHYRCDHPNCSLSFGHIYAYNQHKKCGFHVTSDGQYVCAYEGCGKSYADRIGHYRHRHVHSDTTTTYRCDWEGCAKAFSSRIRLREHKCKQHGSRYRCDREGCAFTTGDKYRLTTHMSSHSTDRQFECALNACKQRFKTQKCLSGHQLALHPDAFPDIPWIECPETDCQYRTKLKGSLSAHLNGHSRPYRCSQCGKAFPSGSHLRDHQRTHNESLQYRCEWPGCEKRFVQKTSLIGHMNAHLGANTYRCSWPGCEKSYTNDKSLRSHVQTHKGVKNYRCQWPGCGYATDRSRYLGNHMDKHK